MAHMLVKKAKKGPFLDDGGKGLVNIYPGVVNNNLVIECLPD